MRFQISRTKFVALVSIPMVPYVAVLLWLKGIAVGVALPATVIATASTAALAWLASLTQVIDISREGIVLYRVNRIAWPDIVSAAPARLFGLRYLKLGRSSGMAWWLPLFFHADTDMTSALEAHAPEGHPLKACVTSLRAQAALPRQGG